MTLTLNDFSAGTRCSKRSPALWTENGPAQRRNKYRRGWGSSGVRSSQRQDPQLMTYEPLQSINMCIRWVWARLFTFSPSKPKSCEKKFAETKNHELRAAVCGPGCEVFICSVSLLEWASFKKIVKSTFHDPFSRSGSWNSSSRWATAREILKRGMTF